MVSFWSLLGNNDFLGLHKAPECTSISAVPWTYYHQYQIAPGTNSSTLICTAYQQQYLEYTSSTVEQYSTVTLFLYSPPQTFSTVVARGIFCAHRYYLNPH